MTERDQSIPDYAQRFPNLASPKFGTRVLSASDEFFGAKDRLISDAPPIFIPDKYDEHGKWMDGWESRRRRDDGHDWCLLELGVAGRIHGAEIDTSHFTGNYPPGASIEACPDGADIADPNVWTTILDNVSLNGNQPQYFPINSDASWKHVRLNIFPDGGVARLRLFGAAAPNFPERDIPVELSALKNGGRIIDYNDAHYGDLWALLSEGRGKTMGDGWETRRRREPGNDWIIIALGERGIVENIEIDTAHFKGNFPDSASVETADVAVGADETTDAVQWTEILSRQKLGADSVHEFGGEMLKSSAPATHVRLNIFPDGGVSRFRVFGKRIP